MHQRKTVFLLVFDTIIITGFLPAYGDNISKKRADTTVSPAMLYIAGGTFMMGTSKGRSDEGPPHKVTLDGFEIGMTEVTQDLYQRVTGNNPSNWKDSSNLPVERVSWFDAIRFCNKLSEMNGLEKCYNESTWICDFTKNG